MATSSDETPKNSLEVQPSRKKNLGFPKCYPFPIVRETADEKTSWNCVVGHLKDHCVEVTNANDIELLFTQGFFGKGTLSRSTPHFVEKKFRDRRNLAKSKQKESKQDQEDFLPLSANQENKDENDERPAKRMKEEEIEVVLSEEDKSNLPDEVAIVSESQEDEKETLQLSLEEAYFLSYGLGVLVVKDKDQPLDLMRLWHKFCEIHPGQNFPIMYTAYHHFRSKGWIVRCGIKYGAHFILYKDGPPFYHSSYAVIVKPVKEQNFREISAGGHPNWTWSSLAGLHRICSHANKDLIILYVVKPSTISDYKISTPFCISQYLLEEVLFNRWVPSEEQRFESS